MKHVSVRQLVNLLICFILGLTLLSAESQSLEKEIVPKGYGVPFVQLGHTAGVESIAVSSDGKLALSVTQKELKLWDLKVHKELMRLNTSASSAAFLPESDALLFGNAKGVWQWQPVSRKVSLLSDTVEGVSALAVSPDGHYAAVGNKSGALSILELKSGKVLHSISEHSGKIASLAFSPDSQSLLSGSWDHTMKLWDVASGKKLHDFQGHTNLVRAVAFSPDGRALLSASVDCSMILWSRSTGKRLKAFVLDKDEIVSALFSTDGRFIFSGSGAKVTVWDVKNGKVLKQLEGQEGYIEALAVSPDGNYLLSGSDQATLKLWNIPEGREITTFSGTAAPIYALAVSGDGTMIAASGADKVIRVWERKSGKLRMQLQGSAYPVAALAFTPDGRSLLSSGGHYSHGEMKLWDLATGQERWEMVGHTDFVSAVAISPDGRFALSGSHDYTMVLWDLVDQKRLHTFSGHSDLVEAVAFSEDGRYAVSVDERFHIWDIRSGKQLVEEAWRDKVVEQTLQSFQRFVLTKRRNGATLLRDSSKGETIIDFGQKGVTVVAVSPDEAYVVTGDKAGSIEVWERKKGTLLATMYGLANGEWVTITAEGFYTASAHGAALLSVLQSPFRLSSLEKEPGLHRPDKVMQMLQGSEE